MGEAERGEVRIALVVEWLDAWRGGAETSTLQFLHHLMGGGHELHVFTRSRPSPTPGMFVHTVSGAAMSRTRRSMTFAHRVDRLIAHESFDVVHAISPCRSANIYQPRGGTVAESIERNIALRRHRSGRALKRYVNHFNFKQRYMLSMERKLLGGAEGPTIVAISDYVVRQLKAHYHLPDGRIHKVFNGVDADRTDEEVRVRDRKTIRQEFGIAADDLVVLTVAHNFRLKGVQRWMEALAYLVRNGATGVRSLVVGRGDSERWHRLAGKLGIEGVLRFTGPSDRVPALRHAADVLVHPTYYDPCSRVVLEGMAAGLPCVTTVWDGASEMIDEGRSGFVLDDPWDIVGLADRVERLKDAELRRQMGTAAAAAAGAFSMARHAQALTALYESIATAGARS